MGTDWSQFWPGMMATFVGFVLALLGQWCLERIKEYRDSEELGERIAQELSNIKNELEIFADTALDIQPLKTPAWNTAINAGQVSLLKVNIRERLFRVYNAIQEFNSWCLVQTNYYFENGKHNTLLTNELGKLKTELLSEEYSVFSRSIIIIIDDMK